MGAPPVVTLARIAACITAPCDSWLQGRMTMCSASCSANCSLTSGLEALSCGSPKCCSSYAYHFQASGHSALPSL